MLPEDRLLTAPGRYRCLRLTYCLPQVAQGTNGTSATVTKSSIKCKVGEVEGAHGALLHERIRLAGESAPVQRQRLQHEGHTEAESCDGIRVAPATGQSASETPTVATEYPTICRVTSVSGATTGSMGTPAAA